MFMDLPPDPQLWLPPKPAIVRPADRDVRKPEQGLFLPPPLLLPASFTANYLGSTQFPANATAYATADLIPSGLANQDVLVGICARDSVGGRVDDVRVGIGTNMAKIAENNQSFGHLQFWLTTAAFVGSGSAVYEINIGASGTLVCLGVYVWQLIGLSDRTDAKGEASTQTDNGAMSFTCPSGAKTFALAINNNTSASVTVSGASKVEGEVTIEASALRSVAAVGTSSPIAFDWSTASNVRALAISLL
jgi:hypothetical protein